MPIINKEFTEELIELVSQWRNLQNKKNLLEIHNDYKNVPEG